MAGDRLCIPDSARSVLYVPIKTWPYSHLGLSSALNPPCRIVGQPLLLRRNLVNKEWPLVTILSEQRREIRPEPSMPRGGNLTALRLDLSRWPASFSYPKLRHKVDLRGGSDVCV